MKSRYVSRIVTRMFLGQLGCVKDVFDNFKASKRIFWRVCASWRPIIQGKTIPLQGLWPTIPFDGLKMSIFGASKMKSRYDSRNVTRMFLGQPGYGKHVFDILCKITYIRKVMYKFYLHLLDQCFAKRNLCEINFGCLITALHNL